MNVVNFIGKKFFDSTTGRWHPKPSPNTNPMRREESEISMDFFGAILILATVSVVVALGNIVYNMATKIAIEQTGKKKRYATAADAVATCIVEFERIDEHGLALRFTERDENCIAFQAMKPDYQSIVSSSSYTGSDNNIRILEAEITKYLRRNK